MSTTIVKTTIKAPIEKVWNIIGAVGGVDTWSPVINSCEIKSSENGGLERICGSEQGILKEKILKLDSENKVLAYLIYEQPFLPVEDLVCTVKLTGDEVNTHIVTTSEYQLKANANAEEVEGTLHHIYTGNYMGIEEIIKK